MSTILPRLIRYRDAPAYLGMCKGVFDEDVRPHIREVTIGKIGVAFDRLDLDAWADAYLERNGRPGKAKPISGERPWAEKERPDSASKAVSGKSKKPSTDSEFTAALELVTSRKQNASSHKPSSN